MPFRVLVVEMAENDSYLALVENLVPLLAGCVALEVTQFFNGFSASY